MNVIEIEERIDEILAKGFKPADFIFDFIEAYGAPKSVIKQLRGGQQDAFGQAPVLWKRNVHFQHASEGQVGRILNALATHKDTEKQKVRYIISTDGHDFGARDMKSGESLNCLYDELGVHFGFFLPLAGIERYKIADENPVDIKATGRLAKFYDSILQDNPTWKGDEKRHALNHFITQVVFCLFGEDTGILPPSLFSETIATYCETDSTQAQKVLTDVFTAMSLPEAARGDDCPTYARKFPHVNGGLFKGAPEVPRFTKGSVRYLIDASQLNWRDINPDIFGSMIQSIVNTDQRGELGMHYTSVPNILKVLDPLFLDDLREQVNANWNNKKGLHGILRRLSKIRVFDPACGSGNFLVIAYRELRAIEIKVINRLSEIDGYAPPLWSHVELTNFYGIEYADFAAETAKLSLWIAEYQMNSRYEDAFGKRTPALPLKETGHIVCGNALRVAWESVCPHSDDPEVETYVVGNPPYLGGKKLNEDQNVDKDTVFFGFLEKYGMIDYVGCWIVKAAHYIRKNKQAFSFVTTSSINQGQQSFSLWPKVLGDDLEITSAYRPFMWTNNAANQAGVYCTICAVRHKSRKTEKKLIFDEGVKTSVSHISGQIDVFKTSVTDARTPISKALSIAVMGSNAIDGGILQLSESEANELLASSEYRGYVKKYASFEDIIKRNLRYILVLRDEDVNHARGNSLIASKIAACKIYRESAGRDAQKGAKRPHALVYFTYKPGTAFILPQTTTTSRHWLPSSIETDTVITIKAYAIYDFRPTDVAIFSSKLHYAWALGVCSRLGNALSYSNTSGWNTFPVPELSDEDKEALTKTAEGILLARDTYFDKTIAELYDPDHMQKDFPELWEAHQRNDEVLETIYNGRPFKNDTERLEHLFARYSAMVGKK